MNQSNLKLIAIAVATAVSATAAPSFAFPVTYSLEADTNVTLNGVNDSDNMVHPSYVNAAASEGGWPGYSSANGKADDSGWIYATSYGSLGDGDSFEAYSTVTQTVTVTNDTTFDQFIDFTFTVNNGSLSIYGYGNDIDTQNTFLTGESSTAAYDAKISLNGNSIWESDATLTRDENGYDFDANGVQLGTYDSNTDPEYYYWGGLTDTLSMGLIAAGDSFTLEYVIETMAIGELPALSTECDDGYGDYGEYGEYGDFNLMSTSVVDEEIIIEEPVTCQFSNRDIYAQFGDPNTFSGGILPTSFVASNPVSVSEPSVPAILGVGLAGLAFMRRRHNKNT